MHNVTLLLLNRLNVRLVLPKMIAMVLMLWLAWKWTAGGLGSMSLLLDTHFLLRCPP